MYMGKERSKVLVTGGSGFVGTNLIECLRNRNASFLNIDLSPPLCSQHSSFWKKVDILNRQALQKAFREFGPKFVVHLAARTDVVKGTTVEQDYRVNTEGTENVISAIKDTPSVSRVVITSTQYVHQPGHIPTDDEDYEPHTVYGDSKVITEKLTRQADMECIWTIIRPTNIWGPWHIRHWRGLYRVMRKGLYFRALGIEPIKSCGYVGNVTYQIMRILELPQEFVHGRTIYLGDRPDKRLEWFNEVSRRLRGHDVYRVPLWMLRFAGFLGDIVSSVKGEEFLITTTLVKNMTIDYVTPMEPTFELLGENPFSMQEGVEQTIAWLEAYDNGKYSNSGSNAVVGRL